MIIRVLQVILILMAIAYLGKLLLSNQNPIGNEGKIKSTMSPSTVTPPTIPTETPTTSSTTESLPATSPKVDHNPEMFTYFVQIEAKFNGGIIKNTSGVLLHPKWVVTCGGCVINPNASKSSGVDFAEAKTTLKFHLKNASIETTMERHLKSVSFNSLILLK